MGWSNPCWGRSSCPNWRRINGAKIIGSCLGW
jgi:hypothetical protein